LRSQILGDAGLFNVRGADPLIGNLACLCLFTWVDRLDVSMDTMHYDANIQLEEAVSLLTKAASGIAYVTVYVIVSQENSMASPDILDPHAFVFHLVNTPIIVDLG